MFSFDSLKASDNLRFSNIFRARGLKGNIAKKWFNKCKNKQKVIKVNVS